MYLQKKEAECMFGLVLYSLGRLYLAVERHAKATGEWQWLVLFVHFTNYFHESISVVFACQLLVYSCGREGLCARLWETGRDFVQETVKSN